MAVDLEAKDLREAFEKGTFPNEKQRKSADDNIRKFTKHLRRKLFRSFLWSLFASSIVVGGGFYAGVLGTATGLSIAKTATFAGTFLVAWATLFAIGGPITTFSGEALHEVIHPLLFLFLFVSGVLLILAGVIL